MTWYSRDTSSPSETESINSCFLAHSCKARQAAAKKMALQSRASLLVLALMFAAEIVEGQSFTRFAKVSQKATVVPSESLTCTSKGKCFLKRLRCPSECPKRKPSDANAKGCFIDCNKCEASCKRRVPGCNGYGSICYDPRFIGGDGKMFYFHGEKDHDFCLVRDSHRDLHVNAHFIGLRPEGRTRDFTWVQALAVLYAGRTLTLSASRTAVWFDAVERLEIAFDGVGVALNQSYDATWVSPGGDSAVERSAARNAVAVRVGELAEISVRVVPITATDNAVHGYGLPKDDCFAHLDLQFSFFDLSESVTGVLGQTYRKDFLSRVKEGVAMPVMGGEHLFRTSSLLATDCNACAGVSSSSSSLIWLPSSDCSAAQGGFVCRR